jgi:hypothetical protein
MNEKVGMVSQKKTGVRPVNNIYIALKIICKENAVWIRGVLAVLSHI